MCEAQQETAGKFKQLDRVDMTLNDVKSDTEVIAVPFPPLPHIL
jgi:hypothetical protein